MTLRRDLNLRNRRSLRLRHYDYAQAGAYFVTVVTAGRVPLFGDVRGGAMHLNEAGRMVDAEWRAIASHLPTMAIDAYVVMPNHIHGIVVIAAAPPLAPAAVPTSPSSPVGAPLVGAHPTTRDIPTTSEAGGHRASERMDGAGVEDRAPTRGAPTLGDAIGAFKSRATVAYVRGVADRGWPAFEGRLWQRNYYEHVIRNDESLRRIRQYVADNPRRWDLDRLNGSPVGSR